MKLTMEWAGTALAALTDADLSPWPTQPGTLRAFTSLHKWGGPDFTLFVRGQSAALLVANGYVDPDNRGASLGTLTGTLKLFLDGHYVGTHSLSLPDGTGRVFRHTGPPEPPSEAWCAWMLRDMHRLWNLEQPGPLLNKLRSWFLAWDPAMADEWKAPGMIDEFTEPDVAGSPRLTEYAWAGALGVAFLRFCGDAVPDGYRTAALTWAEEQARRTVLYYGPDGEPFRFSQHPDLWVDEQGWRKDGHGKIARPSAGPWQMEDDEHVALDRLWTAATAWHDPIAYLLLDHYGEALASRPQSRAVKHAMNARERGRVLKAYALLLAAFGGSRPQFAVALSSVARGLRVAFGGTDEWPFPCASPPKIVDSYSHVHAEPEDAQRYLAEKGLPLTVPVAWAGWAKNLEAELRKAATAEGKPADTYTTGPDGLWTRFRYVSPPQMGTILTGLGHVRDVPTAAAAVPDVGFLARYVGKCLLGPGFDNGLNAKHNDVEARPFHDSYAMAQPERVRGSNIKWGGTAAEWTVPGVAALLPWLHDPVLTEMARGRLLLARDLDKASALPDRRAVECYWPALGMA